MDVECIYSISHSIPQLELCSRYTFDIDMGVWGDFGHNQYLINVNVLD